MAPCGYKERDEGHDTSEKYQGIEKGIRYWRMKSRVNRVNETEQLKAEKKKHPITEASGTNETIEVLHAEKHETMEW